MLYILGIFIVTIVLAVVGHLFWIFYRFLLRMLIRLAARSRGQPDVDLTAINRRIFAYLFSVEGLRFWAYMGGIIVAIALILLLKDYIAGLLAIRYIQLAGIAIVTALTYIGGWKLGRDPRQRILGAALMIIGAILLPVNFWYYQKYILMIDRQQAYLVGFICTAVYLFTALKQSSILFSYITPLTFHASVLLILHKLDYDLELYVFLSALLAILYPLAADFLAGKSRDQFKAPLILTALAGLLFAAIAFLYLEHLENTLLPIYLFIAAALILNKIAQLNLDPRYLFLGIPIVVIVYLRHLESFDLAHYWFGLLFAALALMAVGIWWKFAAARPDSPYTFYFQLLPLTLIIFALPVDITSYLYLADKLGSLQQIRRLFTSSSLSIDALGSTWQGVQIGIYYTSYFALMSLVILLSTGLTCIVAGLLTVLNRSKLVGFYSITALFCWFSIGVLKFWHPLLYLDRYFLFYLGFTLALWGGLLLIRRRMKDNLSKGEQFAPFRPALYIYRTVALLLTYILAGVYLEMSVDHNFDYYFCAFSILGLIFLYHVKDFQGDRFLKNLKFAATVLIIGPLMINSFVHDWTSYTFFILLAFIAGLAFLLYGWHREDRIYVTLASLTILTEVIVVFLTVKTGQVVIKLLLLALGIILIFVGVYLKKSKAANILLLGCFLIFSGALGMRHAEARDPLNVDPQFQSLMNLMRANPDDQIIRVRLVQYARQQIQDKTELSEFLAQLPPPTVPDRFQRSFLRDDLAAITGLRAIEGTLQLDAMRQDVIKNEKPTIDLASVTPLTIASHDYPAMLKAQQEKGKFPEILDVERIIPADKMYCRFPDTTSFLAFVKAFDTYLVPLMNLFTTSFTLEGINALLGQTFAIHAEPMRDILETTHLQGITLVIGDPYLHLGTDLALILEMANDQAAITAEATLSNYSAGGRPAIFTKVHRRFIVISNNQQALRQIGFPAHPLSDAPDFLYIKSLQIPHPHGFFYLSEAFVVKLISPEFRIKDLRRYNCARDLLDLHHATMLYLADGYSVDTVSVEKLVQKRYLEAVPVDLHDLDDSQGTNLYRFDLGTETWNHVIYGKLGAFTPLIDLTVRKIRPIEQNIYDRFRWQYQHYFTRYVDPIGIGVAFEQQSMTFHTVVLPLIEDPLYQSTIEYVGRQPEADALAYIASHIPSTYGISLLVRSRALKEILQTPHWFWNSYAYFYRDMQPFLKDNAMLGPELFLGISDFGFGDEYASPDKPYPTTLKEFARLPLELPVVMLQSLENEPLGQAYLRHLFHWAPVTTIQATPVYSYQLLGNIKLYGSVQQNLLTISPSMAQQQEILQFSAAKAAFPDNTANSAFYHLTLMLQPAELQQFKPHLFQMIRQQLRLSCQQSLATLQNLLDLYTARYGQAPEDGDLQTLLTFGNLSKSPFCPQNGTYRITEGKVACSLHGTLETYHEPERITEQFFLQPLFDALNRLTAQLRFTEEGIVSQVRIEFHEPQ